MQAVHIKILNLGKLIQYSRMLTQINTYFLFIFHCKEETTFKSHLRKNLRKTHYNRS